MTLMMRFIQSPMVSSINLAQHDAFEKRSPESILQLKPYTAHSKPKPKNYQFTFGESLEGTVNFDMNYMIFYVK